MREIDNPELAASLREDPSIQKRIVVEGDFLDQGETVATIRAGTRESFLEMVGMGIGYTNPPSSEGHIVFSADTVATLPDGEDVIIGREELGKSPDGFDRALEVLGGEE